MGPREGTLFQGQIKMIWNGSVHVFSATIQKHLLSEVTNCCCLQVSKREGCQIFLGHGADGPERIQQSSIMKFSHRDTYPQISIISYTWLERPERDSSHSFELMHRINGMVVGLRLQRWQVLSSTAKTPITSKSDSQICTVILRQSTFFSLGNAMQCQLAGSNGTACA